MSQHKNFQKPRHHRRRKSWPLYLLVGGGVLLIVIAISVISKPQTPKVAVEVSGSPSLKVDKEKVDLGDVKLGRTVTVSFEVMNVGDKTLRFSKAPYIEVVEGC